MEQVLFEPSGELAGVNGDAGELGHGAVLSLKLRRKTSFGGTRVDLPEFHSHIRHMDFDISHLLQAWEYKPGQVVVRKFKGKDGREKIQLRVDLGLLQMNVQGRPDGKRPFGHPSLFEYHKSRLYKHVAAN